MSTKGSPALKIFHVFTTFLCILYGFLVYEFLELKSINGRTAVNQKLPNAF